MSEKSTKKSVPRATSRTIPVRFSDHVINDIDEAVRITGMSQQEIIRLAVSVGLEDLSKIEYDIAGVIQKAAKRRQK